MTEYSDGKLLIHPKAELNHSIKNEKKNNSEESSQSVHSSELVPEDINALEEKTAEVSNSEESSNANSNIAQEIINNNLEEKSTKENTAE